MKTLYIDCSMGAAGDMLTAALLELLPEQEQFLQKLNSLGIPGVAYAREKAVSCGITGSHMRVTVNGVEEEAYLQAHHHGDHDHDHVHEEEAHGHCHEHAHGDEAHSQEHSHGEYAHCHEHSHGDEVHSHLHTHGHGHHHSNMHDIEHVLSHMDLDQSVKQQVLSVYGLIAQAESEVHGEPVDQIHFHEVGTMDAVADVTAVCMLMDRIHPDQVVASPVHVGSGTVRCAHGVLPVPAPATARILQGVPIYADGIPGELCTPTGAALLRYFVTDFGNMPMMRVEKIGYGMGSREFERADCVRVMLGDTELQAAKPAADSL